MRFGLACTLLVILSAAPARAQFDSATVVGTVRDATLGIVEGAKVTLTGVETGISVVRTSSDTGSFEFPAVKPGLYVVTAEKSGFAMALVENVLVQVGARLRVDLQMPVGQVTERVEVTASSPLLETDSSQRGQVITGEQTRALPLISREYSSLALLTTGVKLAGSSLTTGNTPREGALNVNGLRSPFNNFLIDGVDNNAYGTSNQGFSNQVMQPSPDAIGEFKVVTNNLSAEYGRAAGATINVNYRSGTNALHGSLWEFNRNTSMNATGFFKPTTGKPELDRNQFGGVVGGPIVKNKAFFFADYEGLRQTRKVTGFSTIATPAQRQGILSVDIRDPRSGVVYPAGTAVPMTNFAREVLSGLPDANLPSATNNYSTLQAFTADSNKAGGKVDVQAEPESLDVRTLRIPRSDHRRSAEHSAAVRGRRQRSHLREQPAVRARQHLGAQPQFSARGAVRLFVDRGRQGSAGARHRERARRSSGCPACRPTIGSPAGCRRS